MNTDNFGGLDWEDLENVEQLPPPAPVDPNQPDVPGKRRKVGNLQAAREQKERMAEINEIADAADLDPDAEAEWTIEAQALEDAGWTCQVIHGVRIWLHPSGNHGLWKSEESAFDIHMRNQKP